VTRQEVGVVDIYPLSPMQQGMLFHTLADSGRTGVYMPQNVYRFEGDFNPSAFVRSCETVVERHPVLRSGFIWEGLAEPLQFVHERVSLEVKSEDWQHVPPDLQESQLQAYLRADCERGMNLGQPPLMRLAIIKTAPDVHQIVWTHHHAVLDGWSTQLFFNEVLAFYATFSSGRDLHLPSTRPYRDYIAWLQAQDLTVARSFWARYLEGARFGPVVTASTPQRSSAGYDRVRHELVRWSHADSTALQAFAQEHGLTINTVVQGAWALVLGQLTGQSDVIFGATVSGRPPAVRGIESMIGVFINTLPVRVRIEPDAIATVWLKQLQAEHVEARRYEFSPLVQIQEWSGRPAGVPLFDTIVVFENYPVESALDRAATGSTAQTRIRKGHSRDTNNYPLLLAAGMGSELTLLVKYDATLVDDATARSVATSLTGVLRNLTSTPHVRLRELSFVAPANRPEPFPPREEVAQPRPAALVTAMFADRVAEAPARVAIVSEGQQVTYGELDRRSDELARLLRAHGVGRGSLVSICMPRCLEWPQAILAVLKAGAAYVPLDPSYPQERLEWMIQDTHSTVLLTTGGSSQAWRNVRCPVISIDGSVDPLNPPIDAVARRPVVVDADDLAYVIYTSGSTGTPKGVMVTHSHVGRLFAATDTWFRFGPEDVWTLFHSYAFDFSVWELFGALCFGGRLVLVPYAQSRSPEAFGELLAMEQVTVLNQTPTAFRELIRADTQHAAQWVPALRLVIFGGEALVTSSLRGWFERYGDRRPEMVNMYGITETTVHVTYRVLRQPDVEQTDSVVGVAIPDLQVHVVDEQMQPVPVGMRGEIYVGGAGVSRGYLRRPELTAERFGPDPFSGTPGARLYRSGDVGRGREDGALVYLGRRDHQVKIRGHRIELGEIDAVLAAHPFIAESVVVAREDRPDDRRLVAYFVPAADVVPDPQELRRYLGSRLPDYMIPAAFVAVEKMPRTANDKIDRSALKPPADHTGSRAGLVAPRDAIELQLQQIWQDVLGLKQVALRDNFFELGGHSISAVALVGQVRDCFKTRIGVEVLLQNPTIERFATALRHSLAARSVSCAVQLQPGASGVPPFFAVHPAGGSVTCYLGLAGALGSDQPVYAFQAPGLYGEEAPLSRIEDLAERYVAEMRRVQPCGPYAIGGWSLGGIVAFEMARQVQLSDADGVRLLALFDTSAGIAGSDAAPMSEAEAMLRLVRPLLHVDMAEIDARDADSQVEYLLEQLRNAELVSRGVGLPDARHVVNVYRANRAALSRYALAPFGGDVTLYKAGPPRATAGVDWAAYAANVSVQYVAGTHGTMLEEPQVIELARDLRARIRAMALATASRV
jgi:amino acid adenylation domain-containing protein